jgi:Uma2 family endonuclease
MVQLQPKLLTDAWVTATWENFRRLVENTTYTKAKGYYFGGQMRLEMADAGPVYASTYSVFCLTIALFCSFEEIPIRGLINCSYRKTGVREAQPDISYYVGDRTALAPQGSSIVNLEAVPPPDLAIEIADSSINDDLGKKRLLYEEMKVAEYWVVDVENAQILAFQIVENGSVRITRSQVIPGLEISVLSEVLKLGHEMNDSQVVSWLMAQFQQA